MDSSEVGPDKARIISSHCKKHSALCSYCEITSLCLATGQSLSNSVDNLMLGIARDGGIANGFLFEFDRRHLNEQGML